VKLLVRLMDARCDPQLADDVSEQSESLDEGGSRGEIEWEEAPKVRRSRLRDEVATS
jgi:hypothetical protein